MSRFERERKKNYESGDIEFSVGRFEIYARLVHYPERVSGLKTLDVGASQSNSASVLRRFGADSFALDPAYADIHALTEAIESQYESGELDDVADVRFDFFQDFADNPENYIAADVMDLPFSDDEFDIVTSFQCLHPYLSDREEDLNGALGELIRVTKDSGRIIVFPYDTHNFVGTKKEARRTRHVLEKGISYVRKEGNEAVLTKSPSFREFPVSDSAYFNDRTVLNIYPRK